MGFQAPKTYWEDFRNNAGIVNFIVYPQFFRKIIEGKGFSISHRFEAVASDAPADLFFENPSGSKKDVYIIVVGVVSFAQLWVDIYRDNVVASSGTPLTPINLNFESSVSSVVSAEYGGTYTPGNLVHSTVAPGGSHIRAIGGAVEVGESVVMPEGFNFLIRVTNKSAGSTDLSIRVIWWEE